MTQETIWKEIVVPGFEGLYLINNFGDIKSIRKGIILKPAINGSGYKFVALFNHGKMKLVRIHRLLAEYFIPNPNNYKCVNHKDENKLNNNLDNLEWCTYQYNNTYGTAMARKQNTKNKLNSRGAEKAILQYDTDMNLIKEHRSIRSCGYDARNVVNALKGKIKKAYGYIWKYKNVD